MKRRTLYIAVAILTLLIGLTSTWVYQINFPRFRFISVGTSDSSATYNFQSSDGERVFADDCIGCNAELGNITVYHEYTSPQHTRYLFQSNLEGEELVEQGFKLNEKGQKIGERAVDIFRRNGETGAVRIYWTEGEEFWFIQAPTLKLAQEFESSEIFRFVRSNNSFNSTPR
jgi:hypothetical protein